MFDGWEAEGSSGIRQEKKGGHANNKRSLAGLAAKADAEGVQVATGVRVTGIGIQAGAVTCVETDQGVVGCDQLVIAVGPWIRDLWAMLDLPDQITVTAPDGTGTSERPMWTYWALEEGTLVVDPREFTDGAGASPPVLHVDSDAPLHDDFTGELITDQMWGIYYKPDVYSGGVQGGTSPYVVDKPAGSVAVDPYGPESPEYTVRHDFARMTASALAGGHK